MVKNFKGIVKLSDIQNEFDTLISGLNNAVDVYNSVEAIEGIDYTKGGTTLAPLGYTLTVGGLRQFMSIYDGCAFGVRVFKTANNQCKPTNGILVTRDKIYRIPQATVNGYGSKLFYDPKSNICLIGGTTTTTKTIVIPAATSNTNPWTISTNYSQGTAWKGVNYKYGVNDGGWSVGSLREAFSTDQPAKDGSTIKKSSCKRWITLDYPTTLSYAKGEATLCVQIRTPNLTTFADGFIIGSLAIGFNGSENLTLNLSLAANPKLKLVKVDNKCLSLQIPLTADKAINFKSITIGIPYLSVVNNATVDYGLPDTPAIIQGIGIYKQNPTTQIEVVDNDDYDEVYKIADLNWTKTGADAVWLNDLPNTMS